MSICAGCPNWRDGMPSASTAAHGRHSTAGALHAEQRLGRAGRVLSYLIAGHHAGLHDWHGGLYERLASEDARREL
jgi:hypothetical protein